MRTPESYEKEAIKKYLDSLGADCWHYAPYMKGFGKNGVPDRVGCQLVTITPEMVGKTFGFFFSIEVKREGAKPTPIQERRMAEIGKAGGWTIAGTAEVVIDAFKRAFGG